MSAQERSNGEERRSMQELEHFPHSKPRNGMFLLSFVAFVLSEWFLIWLDCLTSASWPKKKHIFCTPAKPESVIFGKERGHLNPGTHGP